MKSEGIELEKPRRSKSRSVSSRFLSPVDAGTTNGFSPVRNKPRSSTDNRKNQTEDESGFMQKLWPASSPKLQSNSKPKIETLADYLGSDRLRDRDFDRKRNEKLDHPSMITRQRSCSEISRFDNSKESISKENHKPMFGGSMRYTGKFKFPGRSSTSPSASSKSSTVQDEPIVPGRYSVDESALRRRSSSRKSDTLSDNQDSESDHSDVQSGKSFSASYMSSTASSRISGINVASKYSNIPTPKSTDNSPKIFNLKSAMRRANSLTINGSAKLNLAMSPARPISPTVPADLGSFSVHKPPTSPSRSKKVGSLLSLGLDLFKSKKTAVGNLASPLGPGTAVESVHQLRLMHNRWAQWRYINARADTVNWNIANQSENNLLYAMDGVTKLQQSVKAKKLQLEKEKMEMKLHTVLHSQIKALESWASMERAYQISLGTTTQCLHAVVCRVPLVHGAKADSQLASIRLRRASDIGASLQTIMSDFSLQAEKSSSILSEIAEIAAQEKSLLEECSELFEIISKIESKEKSLKCNLIQMRSESKTRDLICT